MGHITNPEISKTITVSDRSGNIVDKIFFNVYFVSCFGYTLNILKITSWKLAISMT